MDQKFELMKLKAEPKIQKLVHKIKPKALNYDITNDEYWKAIKFQSTQDKQKEMRLEQLTL